MNGHSFIFAEGKWKATGIYRDAKGNSLKAGGEVEIIHLPDLWVSDGIMIIKDSEDVEFKNKYEIIPFKDGSDHTTWSSRNPMIGKLTGRMMVISDLIQSTYSSENGSITGSECLLQINDRLYRNWGFVFNGSEKLSSWVMDLEKTD